MVAPRRVGAAPHHVPRGGGERPKQAGKGRSSVALRRMAAIQTLWRVGLQVVGTTPGQVMTGYFFFGLGRIFLAASFICRAVEDKAGREEGG